MHRRMYTQSINRSFVYKAKEGRNVRMVSIVAMIVEDGLLYPGVVILNTITLVFAVPNLRTYHIWHNKQLLVLLEVMIIYPSGTFFLFQYDSSMYRRVHSN